MKKQNRKAFTIVELVIVIAVIGILAAVLIPTFSGIIKSANISSDQTTAATLTTELRLKTTGDITNEAQLMDAIDKAGIADRLVPKSLQYGYHFWFDMKTQTIFVADTEEINDMPDAHLAYEENNDGVVLVNDVQETPDEANISFRDVFDKGYYLIDTSGTIGDVISAIDNLGEGNKDTYKTSIIDVLTNFNEKDNEDIANSLLTKVQKTLIITTSGTFYHKGVTDASVYFANSGLGSHSNQFIYEDDKVTLLAYVADNPANNLPSVSGVIMIPDSAVCIGDTSLHFANGPETHIQVDPEKLTSVFCTNATNATINGGFTISGNELKDAEGTTVATLTSSADRAPFLDFGFAQIKSEDGSYGWMGDAMNNPTLYMYAPTYADTTNLLQMFIQYNDTAIYDGMIEWTVSGYEGESAPLAVKDVTKKVDNKDVIFKNTLVFNYDTAPTAEAVITATVKAGLDGKPISKSFTLKMCVPTAANIVTNIGSVTYALPGTVDAGVDYEIGWQYNGDNNDTIKFDFAETNPYYFDNNNAIGLNVIKAPKIKISSNDSNQIFEIKDNTIKLSKPVDSSNNTQTFQISVDGYITTGFKVTVTTPFVLADFNHTSTVERPYYLGSSGSNLGDVDATFGDLFTVGTGDVDFDSIRVSVYLETVTGSRIPYQLAAADIRKNLTGVTIGGTAYTEPVIVEGDANTTIANALAALSLDAEGTSEYTYYEDKVDADGNVIKDADGNPVQEEKKGKVILYLYFEPLMGDAVADESATAFYRFDVVDAKNLRPEYTEVTTGEGENAKTETVRDEATIAQKLNALVNDNATTNVVLLTDVKLVRADGTYLDGAYHLDIVAGETLYGNGFVIDAKKYVARVDQDNDGNDITHSTTKTYCKTCTSNNGNVKVYLEDCTGYSSWEIFGQETMGPGYHNNKSQKANETIVIKHYLTDTAMLNVGGGTIDNVYIDGPVYPQLQYLMDECGENGHKAHGFSGYYVSGIKVTGDATISNSYVSGFRQPVQASGTKLTLDNTTLRGGNYANLQVVTGDLSLKNVTTLQDQNGMENTFGVTINGATKKVTGVGILVEDTGFGTDIHIEGYLDQYNWVESNQTASLPTVTTSYGTSVDMNDIMEWMFEGIEIDMAVYSMNIKMSRFWTFIHQVEGDAPILDSEEYDKLGTKPEQYINTGILFISLPTEKGGDPTVAWSDSSKYVNISYGSAINGGTEYTGRPYEKTGIQISQEFDRLGDTLGDIAQWLGGIDTDITVAFYSFSDGHVWGHKYAQNSTGIIKVTNPDHGYICVTSEDLVYDGYYTSYGDFN